MNSVILLDIRKAFDTIDHQILTQKLSQYGIQDDEVNFFQSYLDCRTQCYSVNGKLSNGVPKDLNRATTEFMVIGSQNKLNNMDSYSVTTSYLI